ncbi:MAG TPA: 50S ribosomal protein L3 [Candidatus Thermoplasmatota archaeon]|nr:50S ribosomal protein L3 [Candidatus Thermoplasmatota archaeon]
MGQAHRPQRGSHGFSPRVRAKSQVPRFTSWPKAEGSQPHIQGFAGYKAGMTHVILTDYRPASITKGQEVQVPVTIIEVPPMKVAAVRIYRKTPYGLKTTTEFWANDVDKRLRLRLPVPKQAKGDIGTVKTEQIADIRLLAYTQPTTVTGIPKKTPEIMELRVAGGDLKARLAFAKDKLGKEIDITEFTKTGQMIDVAAVTKGFGFNGSVPRWGVKMQGHKDSKNRRDTSPLGPFQPRFIRKGVIPMPGQMGYHQRTEYNKRVLKLGEDGAEITPAGGFLNYGIVRNKYLMLHGSIPGPTKRLIRLREAARYTRGIKVDKPDLVHISTASKQGR